MNTTYHYVVLRLAPDQMRGEVINVGIVLFSANEEPQVITMAPLNKLRAIDATWNTPRLVAWTRNIQTILDNKHGTHAQIEALSMFDFCEHEAVGMFTAATQEELQSRLRAIKTTYVANNAGEEKPKREKRTRLQTALRDQFRKMGVLGKQADDLNAHLVVQNVPVPKHQELKNDFVYKNGVYRLTQTLDYNVSADGLHQKLSEACVKSIAADLAVETYGSDTLRLAVVDVPDDLADAVDSHIDLLLARGFQVFHFDKPDEMANYITQATPSIQSLN